MTRTTLKPEDLAAELGVERRNVVDWTNRYGWPCIRIGRTIRYTREQVEQIIAMQTRAATKPTPAPRIAGQTSRSRRAS